MGTLAEVWRYRHALLTLVSRDLTVRYKRSVLGFLWSFLNPVLLILTFVVVFKYLWPNPEPNYSVKLFTTLLAWRFFNSGVLDGANSVSMRITLVKRVSFPRMILPTASLVANFVDFVLSLGVLAIYFAVVRVTVNWPYLPLALIALVIQIVFTFGLSLVLASLSVFYSDVQFTVGNLFQMWFFLSPVLYSASTVVHTQRVAEALKPLYFLNPMAPVLMAYRSVVPLEEPTYLSGYYTFLAIAAAVAIIIALTGFFVFKWLERNFAKEG